MRSLWPRTVYARLALSLTGLFLVVGVLVLWLMIVMTQRYQAETMQRLNADLAAHIAEGRSLFEDGSVDRRALDQLFHMMMVINPRIELYLLDTNGEILAYSAPPGRVQRMQVDLGPVRRFLRGEEEWPIAGDDPRDPSQRKVFSAAPVPREGPHRGYLYIILAGEHYDSVAARLQGSYTLRLAVGLGAGGLVFVLGAGLLLFARLTRRLRRTADEVARFRESDFTVPIQRESPRGEGDEIDRLQSAFEAMAARIAEQMGQLRQTDALRRELVANVSHDLRTPLASLQGYLETLRLKADELGDEHKRRYLELALKHAERIGRLVDDLFELAKLDANEVQPQREPFSLAELTQDVVQKFELEAERRGLTIEHVAPADLPFVVGDIGLIERVLDNLLENALRHTPSGGRVSVEMVRDGQRVSVQVSDTGHGIAPGELARIFERFYKPARTGDDEGGSGLGLAIARRILELHGSAIQASSVPRRGTTFSFDLPLQGSPV